MKLKAGALFVAVTISFVIAVLISLLIILSFHFKIQHKENLLQKKLERNVASVLNILLKENSFTHDLISMDLYGEEADSVQIRKRYWGIFEVACVKAFSGKYSLARSVQYGYAATPELSPALYLTDLDRPLNLCGKTTLEGICYLPNEGARIEYLQEAGSFSGKRPSKELIRESKNTLPGLEKEILKKISGVFTNGVGMIGQYKEATLPKDSLSNSFLDTTVLIRMQETTLADKSLSGNVIVYSDKKIILEKNTTLKDVLIFAPAIIIRKGFTGNIQAFATDSIIVEEHCRLEYPSTLGIFKKDYKTSQPFIKIMRGTILKGIVFTTILASVYDDQETLITLEKEILVEGQIYAEGFVSLAGEVRGSVWCNRFQLKTPNGFRYDNHLLDAVIDRSKLSFYYVGSSLIASGKKKKIVKWLE